MAWRAGNIPGDSDGNAAEEQQGIYITRSIANGKSDQS